MNKNNDLKGFKLLGIFNSYFAHHPEEYPISGGEKRFFEVVKRWIKQGIDIEILTTPMGYSTCLEYKVNAKYLILPFKIVDKFGIIWIYFIRTIIASIFIFKYKGLIITYSATDILPDIIPAMLVKLRNRKSKMSCIIYHLVPHYSIRKGSKFTNIISYYSQRISHFFIRKFADIIFVDNIILKQDLIKLKFPAEKIEVISMGIDKESIDSIASDGSIKFDACFLGRLHVSKGVFDLIEIWRLVVSRKKGARLAVIGNINSETLFKMKELISRYELENNIKIFGFIKTEDVYKTLKSSKVFVFPSHEEGWCISICEAMTCNLPTVAYDLPVLREIFPNGMIRVKMGDYQSFADGILGLLNNKSKYDKLSKEATVVASKYSWEQTTAKELSLLRDILDPIN